MAWNKGILLHQERIILKVEVSFLAVLDGDLWKFVAIF